MKFFFQESRGVHSLLSRMGVGPLLLLLVLVFVSFSPVLQNGFVNYDDPRYVLTNPAIRAGLTSAGISWAFGSFYAGNWHPITWLSHMLDCQLFGLDPWGHHLSSVILHTLNASLIFILLLQWTGAPGKSFFASALFALHPLRVESVAWVAERKDVLSGFFFLVTLLLYTRYTKYGNAWKNPFYFISLAAFALGLMAKPMLVTLPFVLILLDHWPFRRLSWPSLLEKIPFLLLSAVSCLITYIAQFQAGAVKPMDQFPFGFRFENALVSISWYLFNTVYPTSLAVYYPYQEWSLPAVLGSGLLIAGLTLLTYLSRPLHPSLLVGWLWFLGMLFPVIGLVQVGSQSRADRYTYLPSLGLSLFLVWCFHSLLIRLGFKPFIMAVAAAFATGLLLVSTMRQCAFWKDSESLFRHTLQVTNENAVAHVNLGIALAEKGQRTKALEQLQEAVRISPHSADSFLNLGVLLDMEGRSDQGILALRESIRLDPNLLGARLSLGIALQNQGLLREALIQYEEALRLNPNSADAHNNAGVIWQNLGDANQAAFHFEEALRINPRHSEARKNLSGLSLIH